MAQQEGEGAVQVDVLARGGAIPGARVSAANEAWMTDESGSARLILPAGSYQLLVEAVGFHPEQRAVTVRAGETTGVKVQLQPSAVDEEVLVVASTRTGRRIEDQPMHVEVVGREEIEEKLMMTPGDIVMMLNEMGGLRVQSTAPAMGSASLRIQGMRGRYTRFFSDGLPLFGGQPSGIGLLQIPPMDLGQVEVIKGVASSLYGAGAMGGVVNLVSRAPRPTPAHEVMLNQSTRGASDAILWLSGPLGERTGGTLLAGFHRQSAADVDDDGWADLAAYERVVLRPRGYWNDSAGGSLFATAGFTREQRDGGTLPDATLPATDDSYTESLETTRFDVGLLGQKIVGGRYVVTARAAAAGQRHDHRFGEIRERDRHSTWFGELAVRGGSGSHTWVAGAALEVDSYDNRHVPRFDYSHTSAGAFVQDDFDLTGWLSASVGGRVDWHDEYGTFFSPRVSTLMRVGRWTSRASFGRGFFGPTPLTEETEAAGLTRLEVPEPLVAERGRSFALDLGYDTGTVATTVTWFASRIDDPVVVEREERYVLRNLDGHSSNRGLELLVTMRRPPFVLTGSYTWVVAEDVEGALAHDVPLTPRHSAGVVAMIESEETGRVGVELYYTGRQSLEADPYRTTSEPYLIVGVLAERRLGRWSVFVNGENLTGVRQSDHGTILLPARGVDGRWTVDAWAPLDGRTINGGIRLRF